MPDEPQLPSQHIREIREEIREIKRVLVDRNDGVIYRLTQAEAELYRLTDIIDGRKDRDTIGVRERLKAVEDFAAELRTERAANEARMKGIMIGLMATGTGTFATLVAVLRQLFGGP